MVGKPDDFYRRWTKAVKRQKQIYASLKAEIAEGLENEARSQAAYNIPQAAPTPGKIRVIDQVMQDLMSRAAHGKLTYGTYLETHNGRDALRDAYEEALDLAMYLKQALLERGEP